MDENNQTVNLGGNVGGVVPPVFDTKQVVQPPVFGNQSVATSGYAQVVQSPVIPQPQGATTVVADNTTNVTIATPEEPVTITMVPQDGLGITQNMHSQVITTNMGTSIEEPVKETAVETEEKEVVPTEPQVIDGEIKLPTVYLRDLVNAARKVGIASNMIPLSEVLNILFTERGIILRATSGKADIEIIDTRYIFKQPVEMSLDIRLFTDFINAVSCSNLILSYDVSTAILTVIPDNNSGVYKFTQKVDLSTQRPVINELTFNTSYASMKAVSYDEFVRTLTTSKTVRTDATKLGQVGLEGTYYSDIIASSDGNIMLLQTNKLEINDKEFFLKAHMCDLISTLPFDVAKFRVGFVANPNTGKVNGIVISDEKITICSDVEIPEDFPVEVCKNYWNADEYVNKLSLNTKAMIDILKPVIPFINPERDKDRIAVTVAGADMKIVSLNGGAESHIMISNANNYATSLPLYLPAKKLYNTLQTISDETFNMLIDTAENSPCMCLTFEDYKCLVAYVND